MITGSATKTGNDSRSVAALIIAAAVLLVSTGRATAEDRPAPPRPDFGIEIQTQGAAALQKMTRDLKRDSDWGRCGAAALAVVLERQAVTDEQVAGNTRPNCKHCHDKRERG